MEKLGDGIRKLLLAGIGTAAVTAEKSKEILDDLVKKGELTVEQGKVLNQELKHNIKETLKENVNVSVKASTPEELQTLLDRMTPEQLAQLKAQIADMEEKSVVEEQKEDEAPAAETENEASDE
ncbi:MAG: phasin family protein [Coprococcus sp.]